MPGAVVRHDFAHVVVELLPVFGFGHVYEVDHDYSAHIAKSQLASYFVGGAQVHFQGVGFLVIARFCAVAGVYVDHMEKAQPDTKAAKKPATPATQAPQAPKQNKQQEATLLLPAHEESTAPKTTSVQAIPQHDSIEDNPATTATDNLPENTSAEAEIATENGTAPGAPAKLTKSQRRRRARKRSREAAKAALAESAETVEAEDAPMQEQPAD